MTQLGHDGLGRLDGTRHAKLAMEMQGFGNELGALFDDLRSQGIAARQLVGNEQANLGQNRIAAATKAAQFELQFLTKRALVEDPMGPFLNVALGYLFRIGRGK